MNQGALKLLLNLFGLLLALLLALRISISPPPPDSYFEHLAAGRLILQEGGFPAQEPFYFALGAGAPYDKEAWLFGVAAQGLNILGGPGLAGPARSALLVGLFLLLLAAGFRRQANPFSSAAFALWALHAIQPFAGLGPPLASYFFFALCLYVMEGPFWASLFSRWIWLAPLAALWANVHGAALVLLPLALAWGLSSMKEEEGRPAQPGLSLALLLGVTGACVFLHPSLLRLPQGVLDLRLAHAFEPGHFEDMKSGLLLLAAALVCLLGGAMAPGGDALRKRDLSLFFLFLPLALAWRPLLPFALLLAAPMAARRLDLCLDALGPALTPVRFVGRLALMALGALWLTQSGFKPLRSQAELPPPRETLAFFEEELLGGHVFADHRFAGRVLYALAPGAKIFGGARLKGREARDYAGIMEAEAGLLRSPYEKALERYGADFALLHPGSPLAKAMARSREWQPVDFDNRSVLYARVQPGNAALIKARSPRGLRPGDPEDPFDESRLPQVEADLESRLNLRPKSGVLHHYEARLWLKRGNARLARQWLEKGIKADPAFGPNYRLLGELRLKEGDKDGAKKFLDRAASLGMQ